MNLNLIKCAFNKHVYGKQLTDDTLNEVVQFCKYCNHRNIITKNIQEWKRKRLKGDIISDLKDGRIMHARTNLEKLIKDLGYKEIKEE